MPKSAQQPRTPDAVPYVIAAIVAVTAYRIALLPLSTADLFLDEAQYWLWGQNLDWGYYSKPPLIGWLIRGVTELAGSDSPFWVRLPGALLHATTALLLIGAARRVTEPVPAALVGLAYATMPAVAVGSFLISTDTVMLPFFAGALWIYLSLIERSSVALAVGLGLCLGLGMMAKYAAIYFVLCAVIGATLVPQSRIAWRDLAIATAVACAVFAPNVIWNLQNDLTTLSHTADNVDWVREPGISLNLAGVGEFLASQFAVMGPVLFAAYLWILARAWKAEDWRLRWLVWMSVPILALVSVQALLSKAYANWAVATYAAALLLTVPWLWTRARTVLWAGLAVNMILVLAVPVAATQTTAWRMGDEGNLVLRRYTGRTELSSEIFDVAAKQSLSDIVATNRHVLADLTYAARETDMQIYSAPFNGPPPHYYAQLRSFPMDRDTPFLFVTLDSSVAPCDGAIHVASWTGGPGAYAGRSIQIHQATRACWGAS